MIIDSHMHFGKILYFDLGKEKVLESLNKYNIDIGLVSSILGAEFDQDHNVLPSHLNADQRIVIKETVDFVKEHPGRLRGMFWIKPHTQGFTDEIGQLLIENRDYICALKVHPFYSNLAIDDPKYEPFFNFAEEADMPVAIHSSCDDKSNPKQVYKIAKKYPRVNFINVHMGLLTDNSEAIEYCSRLDNLYCDTSWVTFENVIKAVRKCGSEKILFGTDAPIDGVTTYDWYEKHLKSMGEYLKPHEVENVLYKNSKSLFKII